MKKILLLVFSILIFAVKVKGIESEYTIICTNENEVINYPVEIKKIDNRNAFVISPFNDYNLDNKTLLNNLAFASSKFPSDYKYAVIQLLIFKETNKNYEYKLYKDNTEINYKGMQDSIYNTINTYDKDNNKIEDIYEYNISKNDKVTLEFDFSVLNYDIKQDIDYSKKVSFSKGLAYNKLEISNIKEFGNYKIDITNKLNISNNLIYASYYSYKDFSIFINILSNKIIFNLDIPDNEILCFDMYDLEDNYLNTYNINKKNNIIEYDLNTNIKLIEKNNLLDDITIFEQDNHIYEINYKKNITNDDIKSIDNNIGDVVEDIEINIPNTYLDIRIVNLYVKKNNYYNHNYSIYYYN